MKTSLHAALLIVLGLNVLLTASGCGKTVSPLEATRQAAWERDKATQMASLYQGTARVQATSEAQIETDWLTQARQWPVVVSDDFNQPDELWYLGEDQGTETLTQIRFAIEDGKFHWTASTAEGFVWWNRPEMDTVSDFYLSVDAQQLSGAETGYYGVVMRMGDGNYYAFEFRNNGEYGFDLFQSEEWINLIPWEPSSLVQPGLVNHLEIIAQGSRFGIFINGELANTVQDAALGSGYIGLMVGLDNPGETGDWVFDNFVVRAP